MKKILNEFQTQILDPITSDPTIASIQPWGLTIGEDL